MRKLLSCVLMMTLVLSGCKAGGGGEDSPDNLAALIRGEYLSLTAWTATVSVTADGPLYRWDLPDESTYVSVALTRRP